MSPEMNFSARRILAVRLDNIGDVILLGPALRSLKQAYPDARLTLMASPAGEQAASLLPWVDDVFVWRAIWQEIRPDILANLENETALIETLRLCGFEASIIFTSFTQSPYPPAYACMLAGIPFRAGQSKEFGGGVLTHAIAAAGDALHQAERNLNLLERLGIPVPDRDLEIKIPDAAQQSADQLLKGAGVKNGRPFITIVPGASCSSRRYPIDRFVEVAVQLRAETGFEIVLVGSARERELYQAALEPLTTIHGIHSLMGQTSIAGLAGVLQRSALVIANNSAALHLADALKKPNVILDSGTEQFSQWAPRSSPSVLLRVATDCSPCYRFECPYQLECLEILPETVVDAAKGLLSNPQRSTQILEFAGIPSYDES